MDGKDGADRKSRARETFRRLFGREPDAVSAEPQPRAARELAEINEAYAFGDLWSREALPIRTRSLLTIGILTALYRSDQLRLHIQVALRNGVTPDEILEAVYHAGAYAGLPVSANGRAIAVAVFREQGIV